MIGTIISVAAKIGIGLIKGISVLLKATLPVAKALSVPASIASKVALKAGLSVKAATQVKYATQIGTALIANALVKKATSNLPNIVAKPINTIAKITIARSFGF